MNLLSNHQKGYRRDRTVIDAIDEMKVLDTDQLKFLFYPSHRVAQRRLKILADKQKLFRIRESIDQPYYYYLEKRSQAHHAIGINWARIYLDTIKKGAYSLERCEYEPSYDFIRPDAVVSFIATGIKQDCLTYFIEFDQSTRNHSAFDKIKKYNQLYDTPKLWRSEWWAREYFPDILIVTETEERKKVIENYIKKDNKNNLVFIVKLLDKIKGELMC